MESENKVVNTSLQAPTGPPQNAPGFRGKTLSRNDPGRRSNWSLVDLDPQDKVRLPNRQFRRYGHKTKAWYWEGPGKPEVDQELIFIRVYEEGRMNYSGWFSPIPS